MSLYRKYRSQSFDEIIGQDHIVTTLQNALKQEQVAHAYLFSGPRGTGKTSIARILAKELGCKDLDVIEIDAASHRGIDEVRALREQVQFQPTASPKKVYILDEVHMLTKEAFNALLKTLEEPPAFVHFVMCTTEPHKIPATIISRSQRFDFRPGTEESVVTLLQRVVEAEAAEIPEEILRLIARQARGGYRDSLSMLEQLVQREGLSVEEAYDVLGVVDDTLVDKVLSAIESKDVTQFVDEMNALSQTSVDWYRFIDRLLEVLRERLVEDPTNTALVRLTHNLTDAYRLIKYSPVPQLPIESTVILWMQDGGVTEQKVEKNTKTDVPHTTEPKKESKPSGSTSAPTQKPKPSAAKPAQPIKKNTDTSGNEYWQDVLEAIKPRNHTLEALLKACTPSKVEGHTLILSFKYQFHRDRVDEISNRHIVEEVISEVLGKKITIECEFNREEAENAVVDISAFSNGKKLKPESDKPMGKKSSGNGYGKAGTMQSGNDTLAQAMREMGGKIIDNGEG